MRGKAPSVRSPQAITVRDNVPPGAVVVPRPEVVRELVRMFGETVLRGAEAERERAPG